MPFTYRPLTARLRWMEDGLPFAEDFGDVYYSRADALGESSHVFHAGSELEQRFETLHAGSQFIIGELGFGAGLNFLNTCRLWTLHAPVGARLHYIASELYPFSKADMARLWCSFPELAHFASKLLELYPDHTKGTHQFELQYGEYRVCLTLLHEDANTAFATLAAQTGLKVDAWFLDGFSPRKNPAMWQGPLLRQLAVLSHPGSTVASYSVFGGFRRQLADAGFICEKRRGFRGKRHMLHARFGTVALPATDRHDRNRRTVCIIGGGLAGCSTAHALATAGWQVQLIERGPQLAMGASGNPQGILHFKPGTVDAPDNRFNLHAYLHATRHYRSLGLPPDVWQPCGMLQLAHDHKLLKRFETLANSGLYAPEVLQVLDATAAGIRGNQAVARTALYFPDAGWLSPARLCAWYCRHPGIQVLTGLAVTQLDHGPEGWEVLMQGADGEHYLHVPHVIICNSADAGRFSQTQQLPLISNRGQVDVYAGDAARNTASVICGQGYLIPAGSDGQVVGGSFFLGPDDSATREQNRLLHLQQLAGIHPDVADQFAAQQPILQRIAERCTLPGRMPVVGMLQAQHARGLWINVGHGSHGLARTPVCAALLASQLSGTPAPLAPELTALVDPQRFT